MCLFKCSLKKYISTMMFGIGFFMFDKSIKTTVDLRQGKTFYIM